jgi:hypothetical protein
MCLKDLSWLVAVAQSVPDHVQRRVTSMSNVVHMLTRIYLSYS